MDRYGHCNFHIYILYDVKEYICPRQVLEQRHTQELKDLDAQCEAEKAAVLTEALSKLQAQHDDDRETMLSIHEQQMNDLLSQGANLTPEELEERKIQLLNKQQQEIKLVL